MKIPEWTEAAFLSLVAGASGLAIVGFTWGGWVTGATARKMADSASSAAVVAVMMPYCLAQAKSDPNAAVVLANLKAAGTYQKGGIIEKAGWATPLGADEPNSDVAKACSAELMTG